MNAIQCDRCKQIVDETNYLNLKLYETVDRAVPFRPTEIDLCKACAENFHKFLEEGRIHD